MPLLDHFHPPIEERYAWESFHAGWATHISEDLNARLPAEFIAMERIHAGVSAEVDVGTFELATAVGQTANGPAQGSATATMPATWSPPTPARTIATVFVETFEVLVFRSRAGRTLVGAIELISPGNKDRPDQRRAFAIKCASYLHQGISLIIVDVVTSRRANLHAEIMGLLGDGSRSDFPPEMSLYAVAYRPVRREERAEVDIWPVGLALAAPLPTMPLRLAGDLFIPVDFESTYQENCRGKRLT